MHLTGLSGAIAFSRSKIASSKAFLAASCSLSVAPAPLHSSDSRCGEWLRCKLTVGMGGVRLLGSALKYASYMLCSFTCVQQAHIGEMQSQITYTGAAHL